MQDFFMNIFKKFGLELMVFLGLIGFVQFLSCNENSTQIAQQKHYTPFSISDFPICEEASPLMQACQEGDAALSKVKKLIKDGALVNAIDYWEFLRGGTTVLGYALMGGSQQIINELLKADANPNGVINHGAYELTEQYRNNQLQVRIVPVLIYAIGRNMPIDIIKQLVEAGANTNAFDPIFKRTTALMLAAALGHTKIAKYLLEMGAQKDLKNDLGKTALDYAQEYKHQELIDLLK